MTLALAVLEIFCSKASIGLKCVKWKREIIQSWIYRILPKVNRIIYTLDTIYDPNIMTLAQAVLEVFCSQASIWVIMSKMEKGNNSVMDLQNFTKS